MANINELKLAKDLIKFPSITPKDAGAINFTVQDKWTDLLQLVLITVIGAYFGGRSLEKVKK